MFKKLEARTTGAPRTPLLIVVISPHDLSTWPPHSIQASNTGKLESSQKGYQKRNQQKWHGFLPQKSPSITSITLFFQFNHCIYFILYFIWGSHKGQPSLKWRKSIKGFVTCFKTTRHTEHNAGPISLRSHGGLNTGQFRDMASFSFLSEVLFCYSHLEYLALVLQ